MYVLIVGAGRIGTEIAQLLIEADQEITVIDRDPRRCAAIEDELGSIAIVGDATESSVLRRAGAIRAELLIATGRNDEDNLVICQMAKHLFDVGTVMALVEVSEHVDLFSRLGIDVIVDTTRALVSEFQRGLEAMVAEEIENL